MSLDSESANSWQCAYIYICVCVCIHSSYVIAAEEVVTQLSYKIVKHFNTSQSYMKYSIYTDVKHYNSSHILYRYS